MAFGQWEFYRERESSIWIFTMSIPQGIAETSSMHAEKLKIGSLEMRDLGIYFPSAQDDE